MSRILRIGVVASLCFFLAACGGGGDVVAPVSADALGTTLSTSISSAQTGIAYDLDIWLPPGYATAATSYPVVYATDCEYRFATLTAVLQQTQRQVILVNVCAMSSARRWVDFTMPGAAPYYRFLTLELIPFVEANYRASPANRILSGHSLSGELALYALYMEDPAHRYFTSIVSEECSCWYDASMNFSQQLAQPIAMEQAMYAADPRLPINLVMAGDTTSNDPNVLVVYNTIAARHYQGLRAIHTTYSLGHVGMDGPAFTDALSFIFAGP